MTEVPVAAGAGISARHDRRWGLIGGLLGAAAGVGSAAIAIFVEGSELVPSGPYPVFFAKRQLLMYDLFLALMVIVGAGIAVAGIVLARRGPFPRTDAFGALLVSLILMLLGATLLFTRLIAITRA